MKFQTGCPYVLYENFESPLWGFLEDKTNTEIVDEALRKRLEPTLLRSRLKTSEDFIMESMAMAQIGLPYKRDGNKIYVSGAYLIIKRIVEYYISKLPDPMNPEPITKLLNGYMYHEYYTTGKYGEKMFDMIDETITSQKTQKPSKKADWKLVNVRNEIIPAYLEEVEKRSELKDVLRIDKVQNKIRKGIKFNMSEDDYDSIERLFGKKKLLLKVSKEGIDFAKKAGLSDELIRGLRQTRIERGTKFTITLLVAIITSIYFDAELFLYYNPYMYEMGICDRKGLDLKRPDVYLFVDFGKVIKTIFCPHCFKKFIGENKFISKDKLEKSNSAKDNQEIIKTMFDDLYSLSTNICPDDLDITVEGKVLDKNRFLEIDEKLPYGKVGFDKYDSKKGAINFSVKKELKKYKKKVE